MKILFKFVNILIFIVSSIILVPNTLKGFPIILLLLVVFITYFKNKEKNPSTFIFLYTFPLYFLLYLITLTYSVNIKTGFQSMEKLLSFLAFPLIFYLLKSINFKIDNEKFFLAFIFSNIFFFFCSFIYLNCLEFNYLEVIKHFPNLINTRLHLYSIHPLYYSLYISISLIFLINFINKTDKKLYKYYFFIILILLCLIILVLLMRKSAFVNLLIIAFLSILYNSFKYLKLLIILFIIGTVGIIFTPKLNNQNRLYDFIFNLKSDSSTTQRIDIYKSSFHLIQENYVLGYGIGDVQYELNKYYLTNFPYLLEEQFNSHNQYLDILLTSGIIGFIIFVIFSLKIFKSFYLNNNYLYILVFLLFYLSFLTENILQRENGIIIFVFLGCIFLYNSSNSIRIMNKKTLIIGPFPDPISGVSYANLVLFKSLRKNLFKVDYINTEYSQKISSKLGAFSFEKLKFFSSYFYLYKILISQVIYITPGQTFFGLIKYLPFIFVSKIFNKKLIFHLHGGYLKQEYDTLKGIKKKIFKTSIKQFDVAIVLSKSLVNNFIDFLPPSKIKIVPNFIADELIEIEDKIIENKNFKEIRLCFLSNLIKEKGINNLVDTLLELQNEGVSIKLKIAGNTMLDNPILDKIKKLTSCEYLGVVNGNSKKELLLWSNVFCLPTYYSMEGQPISILEAMSTGNLILTCKHAGIPDICSEENAIFVEKNNTKSLKNKLLELNNLPLMELKKYALTNKKLVNQMFTEKIYLNNLLNVIKNV